MPRRLLGICILLLVPVMYMQAQGDAVLLKVGPDRVGKEEFEYHYRRSPNRNLDLFLQAFIGYRLEVLRARELGLDTLREFRSQVEYLQQAGLSGKPSARAGRRGQEWIRLSHVTIPLKQRGEDGEQLARQRMDSLYAACRGGADWKKVSEELPWTQTRFLLKEWQEQVDRLERNQVSPPFYSPMGLHLIAWEEKRTDSPPEPVSADGKVSDWRRQEMKDGLLVAFLTKREPETAGVTDGELEEHFRRHRNEYGGGVPHFRGMVIHSRNKKEAKALKKYLRKYPQALWGQALERRKAEKAGECRYESGCFRIGANPYVDKLAFKCGAYEPVPDYPYTWVLGDKLKKGPESMADVREKVEAGYRKEREKDRMERLKQKYKVEIDEEVLKTVNNEGNK